MARRSEDIDKWVGQRIGELRRARGLSQSGLASLLGLSFQQVQKYEAGLNRVSAARLFQLSALFECPLAAFFPEQSPADQNGSPLSLALPDDSALRAAFARIPDAGLRRSVLDVVEALALR